jgi:D-sedoheptulose 7-phosphate isomerase
MSAPMAAWIHTGLDEASALTAWLIAHERQTHIIERIGECLAVCLEAGGRVFTCGNGGSMCDAMHMAEELTGRFRHDRRAFAAQAISDPAHLSCVANDYGYQHVFARAIEAWGRAGDVLVAFSTSGNSGNVLLAAQTARQRGMTVVGMLGRDGGQLAPVCDLSIIVPARNSDRIQEVHIKVVHLLIESVERRLVPENYAAEVAAGATVIS